MGYLGLRTDERRLTFWLRAIATDRLLYVSSRMITVFGGRQLSTKKKGDTRLTS